LLYTFCSYDTFAVCVYMYVLFVTDHWSVDTALKYTELNSIELLLKQHIFRSDK